MHIDDLLFVSDLVYYNGPLVTHYQSRDKRNHYILWTIKLGEKADMMALLEFSDYGIIRKLLANELPCRELFNCAERMWSITGPDRLLAPKSVKRVTHFPEKALPKDGTLLVYQTK